MIAPSLMGLQKTTNYKLVLPFYIYAALSFLVATILLLLNTDITAAHYFHPKTLAITHAMALGWGTMIILGASHQLLPVLIEGELSSDVLAYLTFGFTAIGIPFVLYGMYHLDWANTVRIGAILVNTGILFYVINVFQSAFKSKRRNIHAWYIIAASLWLLSTTGFGLLLVYNFNIPIFNSNSVDYLSIHAHLGLVGWFLLLVIGVGSRLIPMFLISKYTNNTLLWWIFYLIHVALVSFLCFKIMDWNTSWFYVSIALALIAILLFAYYIRQSYAVRIRKGVDEQMKASLIAVLQLLLPFVALIVSLLFLPSDKYPQIALIYGFCILFGWITAIILGMTFKTLPFIVWNRVYRKRAVGKTPVPKELFSEGIYIMMLWFYLGGFILFIFGVLMSYILIIKIAAAALLLTAILYTINVFKTLLHKPKTK